MGYLPRLALLAALAVVLAATTGVGTPPAHAATGVKYGITDDAWLQSGPGTLAARLARLHALGVKVVRFTLNWNLIAPAKPDAPSDPEDASYDWSKVDPVLDGLHSRGMTVVMQLNGAPTWANGGRPANYAPTSATTFRDFATAAATRYSWVKRWLIWNEPNQVRWLRPTSASVYTTRLLNPAYLAIHRAISGALVAGGGTAPRGSTGGVSPVAWLTSMRAAHARLDAYAHNPYPLDPKRESPLHGGCTNCTTITMATINRLVSLVGAELPARAHLADRVRLSDQSARPAARRVAGAAGALRRRGLVRRVPHVARRHADPFPGARRAEPRALPERRADARRKGKARLRRVSAPARSRPHAREAAPHSGASCARPPRAAPCASNAAAAACGARSRRCSPGAGRFFRWTGTLPRGTQVRLHAGSIAGPALTIV